MDILTRDSQKLALLKEDIMLLPNSLKVQDFLPDPPLSMRATHQLELVMKYALAEVKVLISLTKPPDFTILTSAWIQLWWLYLYNSPFRQDEKCMILPSN